MSSAGQLVFSLIQGGSHGFCQLDGRSSSPVVQEDVAWLLVSHAMVNGHDVNEMSAVRSAFNTP
jgi:hypothetical protein